MSSRSAAIKKEMDAQPWGHARRYQLMSDWQNESSASEIKRGWREHYGPLPEWVQRQVQAISEARADAQAARAAKRVAHDKKWKIVSEALAAEYKASLASGEYSALLRREEERRISGEALVRARRAAEYLEMNNRAVANRAARELTHGDSDRAYFAERRSIEDSYRLKNPLTKNSH